MPAAKKAAAGVANVSEILKQANKKWDLPVGPLVSGQGEDVDALTTGNLAIDNVIGVGGLPIGRSVELYGPPSCGKTTTALQAAAELQKRIIAEGREEYILYSDFEQALDRRYAKALGLDVSHPSFLFTQPDNFEQGANVARELIGTGQVRLAIWDSVAAMAPLASMNAELGKNQTAAMVQAKMMNDFLKQLNPLLRHQNTCAVFLNHEMEVIDMGGGRPGMPPRKSTPGGRALKYFASVRVEYRQMGNIKIEVFDPLSGETIERPDATTVKVRVVKNKVAPPFQECIVRVRFGRGFDNFWSALQILLGHKAIKYSSGYFYFNDSPELAIEDMPRSGTGRPYIQKEENVMKFADDHADWRDAVIIKAIDLVEKAGAEGLVSGFEAEEDEEQETPPSLVGDLDDL